MVWSLDVLEFLRFLDFVCEVDVAVLALGVVCSFWQLMSGFYGLDIYG
jgi:hypothetical protein